jgi:serine/threonine-protein kinase
MFNEFYEIIGELGRGTTGTVYEARHIRINRRVAIKVPELVPEAEWIAKVQRFLHRECQALAYLTSEPNCNIPRLLEVTESSAGYPYSVRELVDGTTLERLATETAIDVRTGLSVVAEVARVVQFVHEHGFAHRNLSPTNVLVARDGTSWLIGFGWVGLLAGSQLLPAGGVGTPVDVDVRGLRALLRWLCGALRHPVPDRLERATAAGPVSTPGAFGEAVANYLRRG